MRLIRQIVLTLMMMPCTLINSNPIHYEVITSAYCGCEICCGKWAKHGLTKTGTRPKPRHTVAVDPRIFPLGSCLVLDGTRYRAEDVGSAIKGLRIDVFHESHQEALRWGKRRVVVRFC